jgi:hypothetical protein
MTSRRCGTGGGMLLQRRGPIPLQTDTEACGVTNFSIVGDSQFVYGSTSDPVTVEIQVGFARDAGTEDLSPVSSGGGLQVATASDMHGNNNGNATTAMAGQLQDMAASFAAGFDPTVSVPPIQVTALSLPLGGLFDFRNEWSPPHVGHRFGNEADIGMRSLTSEQKDVLADALESTDLKTPVTSESPRAPEGGTCETDADCACTSAAGCGCTAGHGCQSYRNYYCDGAQCVTNHWHLRLAN